MKPLIFTCLLTSLCALTPVAFAADAYVPIVGFPGITNAADSELCRQTGGIQDSSTKKCRVNNAANFDYNTVTMVEGSYKISIELLGTLTYETIDAQLTTECVKSGKGSGVTVEYQEKTAIFSCM